jgi:hypothetical protein
MELDCLGEFVELEQFSGECGEQVPGLGRGGVEELTSEVDSVDASVSEPSVHLALDVDSVICEEQCVDVEVERD